MSPESPLQSCGSRCSSARPPPAAASTPVAELSRCSSSPHSCCSFPRRLISSFPIPTVAALVHPAICHSLAALFFDAVVFRRCHMRDARKPPPPRPFVLAVTAPFFDADIALRRRPGAKCRTPAWPPPTGGTVLIRQIPHSGGVAPFHRHLGARVQPTLFGAAVLAREYHSLPPAPSGEPQPNL